MCNYCVLYYVFDRVFVFTYLTFSCWRNVLHHAAPSSTGWALGSRAPKATRSPPRLRLVASNLPISRISDVLDVSLVPADCVHVSVECVNDYICIYHMICHTYTLYTGCIPVAYRLYTGCIPVVYRLYTCCIPVITVPVLRSVFCRPSVFVLLCIASHRFLAKI